MERRVPFILLWFFFCCCLLLIPQSPVLAVDESAARQGQTVALDARTQQALAAWKVEKARLMAELEKLQAAIERATWQREKARTYRETLDSKIAELGQKTAEMETINAELLPVLEETLEKLAAVVDADLPFNQEERHQKLQQVRDALADYDLGLLAKTRAVFDAVAKEVDLGYSVGVSQGEIGLDGQRREVRLLRVGRIGLYALTVDGLHAYVWNQEKKNFTPLDGGERMVAEAIEMAEGIRLINLCKLPMGQPRAMDNSNNERNDL
jgi:hypothetical protein